MKIPIIFLLILFSQIVSAQDIRLAGIEYFNYPKAPVNDNGENYKSSFQELGAFAAYPKQSKNKKTIVVNGIQYALVETSVTNNATAITNDRDFHLIAYNFSIIQKLNNNWKLAATLSPTLASDFKSKLSGDDFFMQGSLVAIKKLSDYTSIGAGVTYTTKLGQPLWLPAVHFRYYKNRHKLNMLLPSIADYAYQLDQKDKLNAGFRASLNGANFHVTDNNINSSVDVNKLRYSRINLGPLISYKISKMIMLEATGGISTARKYQFLDVKGNTYSFNSNNVGFFNIGLAIVPPVFKEN
jgi:hypothetical protein